MKATDVQEGGTHYRAYPIQPIQYIVANGIGFLAGNVIKYVTRYGRKNGAEDIRKAIHYLQLILEFEYPTAVNSANTPKCPWCNGAGGNHLPACRGLEEEELQRRANYGQTDSKNAQCNPEQGISPCRDADIQSRTRATPGTPFPESARTGLQRRKPKCGQRFTVNILASARARN